MAASESRAICDTVPNIDCHSEATVALNTDIRSLTTSKDRVEPALAKEVFESVIAILTLVRVSVPVRFPLLHSHIGGTSRTR